ncbi:MAG TPA: DNA polymerase III subunit beta [Bacteroidia bacterium]|nr:DNA polymerase III subunit beta [Bacteroidia bacterium]
MKFIVSSSTLLKQLQVLNGVLNTSNTLPILDNFLFEIEKGTLTISASDLETTITTHLTVESKDSGNVAVPARLLIDTLKTFPEQPLTFSIDKKRLAIEISSDYGKYKITGQNGDEFPKAPSVDNGQSIEMDGTVLSRAVAKTLFAAGNDELRPVMSGVFVQFATDGTTFVATDAHKLVRYRRADVKATGAASFILPRKPLNLLKNILSTGEGVVRVEYNATNARFSWGIAPDGSIGSTLICRLIDGKYPNYDAVIPKNNPNKLTIDTTALLGSIRRVSIFANKTTHQVRLKIAGSELNISAEDLDFSNEAAERLTCSYAGDDMEIGFNSRFLVEMLTNIDSTEATIEMSAPNRAGILLPSQKAGDAEDTLMLVMPVMLNN